MMQLVALSPQLVGTLLPFSIEPSFPQNSGSEASVLTHRRLGGLSGSGNWPGGMQYFSPPMKPNWGGLYPHGLFFAQCLGYSVSPGAPNRGCLFCSSLFNEGSVEAG